MTGGLFGPPLEAAAFCEPGIYCHNAAARPKKKRVQRARTAAKQKQLDSY
jgi:hypothetical protein